MTKKTFKNALIRGLGSALIELMECSDPDRYREIVMYACLHNTTYDMQSEGEKGWYLYQATKFLNKEQILEEAIINKFLRMKTDDWLFMQLTSLMVLYAEGGSSKARHALYEKYDSLLKNASKRKGSLYYWPEQNMHEWLSVWLISLDGFSAFRKISVDLGKYVLTGTEDFFSYDWFFADAEGKFGRKRVQNYLRSQSVRSAEIKVVFEAIQESKKKIYPDEPVPTLEDVLAKAYSIQDESTYLNRGLVMQFAKNACPEDLEQLANIALSEPNEAIKSELLWGFRRAKPFFTIETLFELAQSDNEDIRDTAYYLMEQTPSEQVRDLALRLIAEGDELLYGISLLCHNFKRSDEALLYGAIKKIPIRVDTDWHSAHESVFHAFKKGRWKPKTEILKYIYENTLCSFCRLTTVELMNQHQVLTPEILKECQYDSNSEIREFSNRILKKLAKQSEAK